MNMYQSELYHYGIKGQKYGVRRFQNKDGSLTEAGRRRYAAGVGPSDSSKKTSGSQAKSSGFKSMNASVSSRKSGSSSKSGGESSGIKLHTSMGKDKTVKTKNDFDVGPIRESMSVIMKKNKEKNRKIVEAYIGGSSNASTTSYSSVSSSPTVSIGKRRVRALIGGG